ncbi:MAG TPA: hypothetical protein VGG02_10205 [Chthoniobacterales bacterium]|jgi:hypothetical protein
MLEALTHNRTARRCLTIALLTIAAGLSGCASTKPPPALVSDPNAGQDSAIPWNHPASWEGREGMPDNVQDGAFGGNGSHH